jgi:3-oxoacyl-[acyl-carrier protein] reductase
MPNKLTNKVAIIIGATKGIGNGIAKVFVEEGAKLVVTGRDQTTLDSTVKDLANLTQSPDQIVGVVADISKPEDVKRIISSTLDKFGRIDILCQNAGIFPEKKIEDMTGEDWDSVLNTNLKGTFFAVKECLPVMKAQHSGKIVVISSITGPRTGIPGLSHYGASKAGINGFIRAAALECAPYNITINAIEPGNILTEGLTALGPQYLKTMTEAIPLGRLGSPRDIGLAALYLVSDDAAFVTGQSLIVDGGQTIPESRQAILPVPEHKQETTTTLTKVLADNALVQDVKKDKNKSSVKDAGQSSWRKKIAVGVPLLGLAGLCLLKYVVNKNNSSVDPVSVNKLTI